jgi:hypothetical protein
MNADEFAAMEKLDTATLVTISAERDGSHRKQAALHILEMRRSHERSKSQSDEKWYKKPIGIVVISVVGGCVLLVVRAALINYFPNLFR